MRLQALKRCQRDVLGSRYHATHEVDVAIQVPVIHRFDELTPVSGSSDPPTVTSIT